MRDERAPEAMETSMPQMPDDAPADVQLERVWQGVTGVLWSRPVGRVERLLGWVLRSPGLARALLVTPSLVLSWLLASAVVLGLGVVLTTVSETAWFALLAPALAGIGVAWAYGPGVDPAYELSQTMAISERSVLLVRVIAVCAINALGGLLATLVSAQAVGLTFGWLLPMVAIATLALAVAVWSGSPGVGVLVGLGTWGGVVFATAVRAGEMAAAVERGTLVPVYLLVTVLSVAALVWGSGSSRAGLLLRVRAVRGGW